MEKKTVGFVTRTWCIIYAHICRVYIQCIERDAKRRAYICMRQYLKYLQFTPFKPHADMHNAFKVYSNVPSSFFAHPAVQQSTHATCGCGHWSRRAQTIAQIHNKTDRFVVTNACGKGLNAFYKDEISACARWPRRKRGFAYHLFCSLSAMQAAHVYMGSKRECTRWWTREKVHCNLGSLLLPLESVRINQIYQ